MEKILVEKFANLDDKGREFVAVVRMRPPATSESIDILDYKSPRIWAIIPCWKDKDGQLTSIRTGNPIKPLWRDSVRSVRVGTGFDYDDIKIIYTRKWNLGKPEYIFAVRTCDDNACVHHRAWGEELTKAPD